MTNKREIPQLLLAAPTSGSGKTTVARGLMALLVRRHYTVQPYKCGPDYIDTKFHETVCGRGSVNLDTFMASQSHVRDLYARYASGADVCVVEGMMGMYDGYDRDRGSCAEISSVLRIPVVLIVNARSSAFSTAALISGFIHFRSDVSVCGVIFNQVGSLRHAAMLRQVCEDLHVECFGCLPKDHRIDNGSRYLGLDFSEMSEAAVLADLMEEHIDWRKLLDITTRELPDAVPAISHPLKWKVCVARNAESFSFVYQETLDALGADTVFFNPEEPFSIPEDTQLLYLPGGYPEKHLPQLVAAEQTRQSVREYAERGGRILAECGGLIYLCRSVVDDEGEYPMCGVLPYTITARKADRKRCLGYRQFELNGHRYKGHEFHYTRFTEPLPRSIVQVLDARGQDVDTPVIRQGRVVASYTHLYWGETEIPSLYD